MWESGTEAGDRKRGLPRRVVPGVLGALSWRHAGVYRDPVTFFSHIVSYNPTARDARYNLGNALQGTRKTEEN